MIQLALLDEAQEKALILEFQRVAERYQQELNKIIAQQKEEPLEYVEYLKAKLEAFQYDAPKIIKGLNGTLANQSRSLG